MKKKLKEQEKNKLIKLILLFVTMYVILMLSLFFTFTLINTQVRETNASITSTESGVEGGIWWHGQYIPAGSYVTFHYIYLPIFTAQANRQLNRRYMRMPDRYWLGAHRDFWGNLVDGVGRGLVENGIYTVDTRIMFNDLLFNDEVFSFTAHLDLQIRRTLPRVLDTGSHNRNTEKTTLADLRVGLTQAHYNWLRTQSVDAIRRNISMSISFNNSTWNPLQFDDGGRFFFDYRNRVYRLDLPSISLGTESVPVAWLSPSHPNHNINWGNSGETTVPPPAIDPPVGTPPNLSAWQRLLAFLSSLLGVSIVTASVIVVVAGMVVVFLVIK